MLQDCGKPSAIKRYNELLQTNKGSATVFALRVIKRKWDELFKGKVDTTTPEIDSEDSYNGVKINWWGNKDFKN